MLDFWFIGLSGILRSFAASFLVWRKAGILESCGITK